MGGWVADVSWGGSALIRLRWVIVHTSILNTDVFTEQGYLLFIGPGITTSSHTHCWRLLVKEKSPCANVELNRSLDSFRFVLFLKAIPDRYESEPGAACPSETELQGPAVQSRMGWRGRWGRYKDTITQGSGIKQECFLRLKDVHWVGWRQRPLKMVFSADGSVNPAFRQLFVNWFVLFGHYLGGLSTLLIRFNPRGVHFDRPWVLFCVSSSAALQAASGKFVFKTRTKSGDLVAQQRLHTLQVLSPGYLWVVLRGPWRLIYAHTHNQSSGIILLFIKLQCYKLIFIIAFIG